MTDTLQRNETFQFGDLLYHVHRINVIGNNSVKFPWMLAKEPPEQLLYIIDREQYERFVQV